MAEARVYPSDQWRLLSSQKKNQEMRIREGWRGFDVPPEGYKLDNGGKPVVDQSFVHNLNSQIIQVGASGNSLVSIPPPPSVPPQIPSFVTTYAIPARQYFGRQGTSQK